MSAADALGILTLVVAVPLNWIVTAMLWWLSRQRPDYTVLRHVRVVMLVLSLIVTVFGLIFVNNDLDVPVLAGESTKLITRATVLISVIPALYWLRLYFRNGNGTSS